MPFNRNTLFYGDNLDILREYIDADSVDLIYLDPPFNSNRNYNVLFKDESGHEADAQITAFEDTWHWNHKTEATYNELVTQGDARVSALVNALRQSIGTNQMMAYLTMMAARLVELHRVLKPTGSLYLHCDPSASHYLKIILDSIFGGENFRNEIVWKRTFAHGSAKKFAPLHDVIFYYSRTEKYLWTDNRLELDPDYIKKRFTFVDETTGKTFQPISLTGSGIRHGESGQSWRGVNPTDVGRHWALPGTILEQIGVTTGTVQERLDALENAGRVYWPQKEGGTPRLKWFAEDNRGAAISDIWGDISPISAQAAERLGYPTQKPLALLERIINASSNKGDIVLDPFCGCGTTIAAAQKLNRRWIGIDITHLSIALMKYRLKDMFDLVEKRDYDVRGEPEDLPSAKQLAHDDRYQFQWWALSLIQARPISDGGRKTADGAKEGRRPSSVVRRPEGKKGSDRGIDGVINFIDDNSGKAKRALVQVKSGKVKSGDVRDLRGVIERENAALGIFITLENATREMQTEAAAAGIYHSPGWNRDYPKLQILAIADLLNGASVSMPSTAMTFKQAERVKRDAGAQRALFDDE